MSKHERSESSASTKQADEIAGSAVLRWLLDTPIYVHFSLFSFSHWAFTHQTAFSIHTKSGAIENTNFLVESETLGGDGP